MKEDLKGTTEQIQENKVMSQVIEVQSHSSNQNNLESESKPLKKKKGLKKDLKSKEVDLIEDTFNLYSRGKIEYAKKHRSASRPKRDYEELNENEENEHLCPCCGLPEAFDKKVTYFNTCDDPDKYYTCGQGVVLYYDYIKFVIIVSFIATIGISVFNIYFSNKYYQEMTKVCNNIYHEIYKFNGNYPTECQFYMTDSDPEIDEDIKQIETYFFRFSAINIEDYRKIYKYINPGNADKFEDTIINVSLVNFITLIILFIFNLIFIYFLFNKGNAADYLIFTVADYAVFLTNLFDLYNKFKENLESTRQMEKKFKDKNKTIQDEWFIDKLGFKPTDDMVEIKMFEKFLMEKIFKEKIRIKNKVEIIDYGVNRIDLCYKSEEIIELQEKLDEVNNKINKIDFDPSIKKENDKRHLEGVERNFYDYILPICPFTYCPKMQSLKDIEDEKVKLEEKITKLIQDSKENISDLFGGAAFITFNKTLQQEEYLKQLPDNFIKYIIKVFKDILYLFCSCCINKNSTSYYKRRMTFEAAPEPEDVIFENIEVKPITRILKTALVYLISVILCGVSFAAIYGLNLLQMYVDENQKSQTSHVVLLYVISFVISGVTSGMDVLLEIVLEILTKWEKQMTWTNYYLSYSVKLTFFSFINSAILPTFCEFFINNSDGHEILISNMLMKFLINAIVTPAMWTLSVGYFLKKIRIYFIEKKDPEEIDMNQKELNDLYEYPKMNVSAKYSYIGKTILMSFFYIPIFPLGICISLLGFILGYWLEKYNLANMYKTPELLNRKMTEFYTNYFVLSFFVYGIGDYIFLHNSYKTKAWSLVNIILFGILIIFPYHQMLTFDYLNFKESKIHEEDYDSKYTDFPNDYERANPMTEQEGKLRFLKARKERGEIKEEEFNAEKKEIENEDSTQAFTSGGTNHGPPRFRLWGGFGKHRRFGGFPHGPHFGFGGHGPHFGGHGPHFGMHGPHFGMHGPHFGMHGPHFEGFPPHGEFPPHGFPPHGEFPPHGFPPHFEGFPPHGEFPPHGFPPYGEFPPHGFPPHFEGNPPHGEFPPHGFPQGNDYQKVNDII